MSEVPKWQVGLELIESVIEVDANNLNDDEESAASFCRCRPDPRIPGDVTCVDDRCINFVTQSECMIVLQLVRIRNSRSLSMPI